MKSKYVDISILIISSLILLSGIFYVSELYSLKSGSEKHLFSKYITNPGIIKIGITELCCSIIILTLISGKIKNWKFGSNFFVVLVSLILGLIPWIELWYGSTFYYGEVRDKQGLGFPFVQSLFLLYPIWITDNELTKLNTKKIIASIIVFLILIIAFKLAYEPWKLWQS